MGRHHSLSSAGADNKQQHLVATCDHRPCDIKCPLKWASRMRDDSKSARPAQRRHCRGRRGLANTRRRCEACRIGKVITCSEMGDFAMPSPPPLAAMLPGRGHVGPFPNNGPHYLPRQDFSASAEWPKSFVDGHVSMTHAGCVGFNDWANGLVSSRPRPTLDGSPQQSHRNFYSRMVADVHRRSGSLKDPPLEQFSFTSPPYSHPYDI
jgi:hypothetical protein